MIAKPCKRAFHLVFTNVHPSPMSPTRAFVDPSGGSAEAMTLAVGHSEDGVVIIDCIRERRAPFNPDNVVAEFAQLLKSYRITDSAR